MNVHPFKAIRTGWQKFMQRPWYLFGLSIGLSVLLILSSAQNAIYTALAYILMGGAFYIAIKHYDGTHVSFDDVVAIKDTWIPFVLVSMVKGLFIFLGLLLFIVPGIYLSLRWMFAELLVLDKGLAPMEALRESSRLTEGNKWALFGFVVLSFFVMIVGLLAFGIGVFAASVIIALAGVDIYRRLSGPTTQKIPYESDETQTKEAEKED